MRHEPTAILLYQWHYSDSQVVKAYSEGTLKPVVCTGWLYSQTNGGSMIPLVERDLDQWDQEDFWEFHFFHRNQKGFQDNHESDLSNKLRESWLLPIRVRPHNLEDIPELPLRICSFGKESFGFFITNEDIFKGIQRTLKNERMIFWEEKGPLWRNYVYGKFPFTAFTTMI
jgi:hypothetical protein